ncbi:MAG TPA: alternative ribosome rescue aminoacyl-tRNA hydrolase ArfB, partial [Candidatus Polarisedimenticolaceae bacterium]|nr:alternative ribosome rescue aminoacyl-tRNA hydrolase ArfB [Candidatus Polarisedimenticolaceae bacterium]
MALHVEIEPGLVIPDEELTFRASRSGGPGGQHVNKVSTKITLEFDVAASRALSDAQRERIRERLGTRLARGHLLHVSASRQRSQAANRREALERFAELLRRA